MKKINFQVAIFLMLVAGGANAQNLIAVQNGGNPTFFTTLDNAFVNAQDGDTVYIPGGLHLLNNNSAIIDKELHLIGVGHHPDSTIATVKTIIYGSLNLIDGSDNSSFEGFYLEGGIYAGTAITNDDVDNIKIKRCYVQAIKISQSSSNWLVYENIVYGSVYGFNITSTAPWSQSNFFLNNVIGNDIDGFGPNNNFKNNLLTCEICYNITNIVNSSFENNIFLSDRGLNYGITGCSFLNNLSKGSFNMSNIDNVLIGNISSQLISSIFILYNNTNYTTRYSYTDDYHLKSTCPGKNAGTDGTDIGIYGGMFPWKEGSIPINPHYQSIIIAPHTDTEGNLNVNIKVSAQDR
jgi:hypothetical protein